MVPVLDNNKLPLMPCSEKRARQMMTKGHAVAYWQKGIFCIKLTKEPNSRNYQEIALGIDPGSKREGYTVITNKSVVLNITTNTPSWVKDHVETRRNLRISRRYRKTPYRKFRPNRSSLSNITRLAPSTKSRWDAKLRMVKFLKSIFPVSIINVEDIKARTMKGNNKKKWNTSFSPLEVGKLWFYSELEKLDISLIKTEGYTTKQHRDIRGFKKSKAKLDYTWEAHNVDSHSLAEMSIGSYVKPFLGLYKVEILQFYRRQLHVQNSTKGSVRKQYGTTISLGIPRGSIAKCKGKLVEIGGSSKGRLSINSIVSGKRLAQNIKLEDIEMLYTQNRRVQFLPRLKPWVSLHNFS